MQFVKPDINIEFIEKRKIAFVISLALILVTIASLVIHKGPRYGVDFAGGTVIQVKFSTPVAVAAVKTGLGQIDLGGSSVQQFGETGSNEYLIRTDSSASDVDGTTGSIECPPVWES